MKFTKKDLAKIMGLKVGDRIKLNMLTYQLNDNYSLVCDDDNVIKLSLDYLVDKEYEILPRKKKLGETTCSDIDCRDCPLNCGNDGSQYNSTLYNIIKRYKKNDSELYEFFKKRLDKEID